MIRGGGAPSRPCASTQVANNVTLTRISPLVESRHILSYFDTLCPILTTIDPILIIRIIQCLASSCTSLSLGPGSSLVLQRHASHYTASDVLALGSGGFALMNRLRPLSRRQRQRRSEGRGTAPHSYTEEAAPSAAELLRDLNACVLGFINASMGRASKWRIGGGDDDKFIDVTRTIIPVDSLKHGNARL